MGDNKNIGNAIRLICPRCGSLDCFDGAIQSPGANFKGKQEFMCKNSPVGMRKVRVDIKVKTSKVLGTEYKIRLWLA